MRHFSIARVIAAATFVLILLSVNTFAQSTNSVEEFVKMINGTWILKVRINPDGSEHAQPLQGYTTFSLKMNTPGATIAKNKGSAIGGKVSGKQNAVASDVGAFGSIQGEETGVLDLAASHQDVLLASPTGTGTATQTVVKEPAPFEPFSITVTGSAEIRLLSEDSTSSTISLRYPDSLVKGTYGVFQGDGVSTPGLESIYHFDLPRRTIVQGREVVEGGTISLINEPRMNLSDSQRGQVGGPGDTSHVIKSHVIRGDIMEIVYGNGTRDIWVRESTSAMKPANVKATLQSRSKARLTSN
jgi:hypothetical protein